MSWFEQRGIPTVAWTAKTFVEDAQFSANVFGCPELAIAEMPDPFTNADPSHIRAMVDEGFNTVLEALTKDREVMPELPQFDRDVSSPDPILEYQGRDLLDCFDTMQQTFVKAGWSDGMPLVPPTPEKVAAMIAASGRKGDEVVGIYSPGFGIGTVEKIAANAVMAGAKPETMPVIMAMAECVLERLLALRTFSMSTGPQAPIVLISGPIAKQIGMNNGICALGPGSVSQVNISIGRTLRLIMMNIGQSYPGISDMDTIGSMSKFGACVAENEERNPWESYRVSKGYSKDVSTVTINVPYGICELFDFENHEPERLTDTFASAAKNLAQVQVGNWIVNTRGIGAGVGQYYGEPQHLILMCPDHARAFHKAGWSIRDIQESLYKKTRAPFGEVMNNRPRASFVANHPELQWLWDKPETEISLSANPDCFDIFVVGGDAGRSLYNYGGTLSITREIKIPGK